MSRAGVVAALLVLIVSVACGKVGPPKPPIVRTPETVTDLRVTQNANQVVLAWTNPARYVDSNAATDLAEIHILRNGVPVVKTPVKAAGQPQSYAFDVTGSLNADQTYTVRVVTKRGRESAPSNVVVIQPRTVPGPPRMLTAVFDQLRITLEWQPPDRNPELVAGYRVQRSDWLSPRDVQGTLFEDSEYEPKMTYTYTVTALRAAEDVQIPGPASEPVMVIATDKKEPATPIGLSIQALDPGQVLLQWTANQERDLKEYLVFRSDQPEPVVRRAVANWIDEKYRAGVTYQLAAEDVFGNASARSMPVAGP